MKQTLGRLLQDVTSYRVHLKVNTLVRLTRLNPLVLLEAIKVISITGEIDSREKHTLKLGQGFCTLLMF